MPCFKLGLPECFCLVVQSKFRGHFMSCVVCISRHKLCRIWVSERRHFVSLTEVNIYLIVCISGPLPFLIQIKTLIFLTILFKKVETQEKWRRKYCKITNRISVISHTVITLTSSLDASYSDKKETFFVFFFQQILKQ